MILKEKIKRKYPDMTMKEFAMKISIPVTTLYGIFERGIEKTSLSNALNIANALEVSILELIPNAYEIYKRKSEHMLINAQDINAKEGIFEEEEDNWIDDNNGIFELDEYVKLMFYNQKHFKIETQKYGNPTYEIKVPKILLDNSVQGNQYHFIEVFNDSMSNQFNIGDILLMKSISDVKDVKDNDIILYKYKDVFDIRKIREVNEVIVLSPDSKNKEYYDLVLKEHVEDKIYIQSVLKMKINRI